MEVTTNKKQMMTLIGLILNSLALILYNFIFDNEEREQFILFTVFIMAAGYFVILALDNAIYNKMKFWKIERGHTFLLLSLFTISCFSVNLEIKVFSEMPGWLLGCFVVTYLALGAQIYFPDMPAIVQKINLVVIGFAIVLGTYFSLYLFPLYIFSFFGVIIFGLTFHVFVPLWFLIMLIQQIIRVKTLSFKAIYIITGIAIPFIILSFFVIKYNAAAEKIHQANATLITRPDSSLPLWVMLAQTLDKDFVTETYISGELTYDMGMDVGWFSPNLGSFAESKLHNPFVTLASALSKEVEISRDDRVKILKTLYGQRHKAIAKLWNGKDLTTSEVLTNIRIYPEYRMAYMEKIISIKNNNRYSRSQQEALYSFQLPEGSVASSLSLWINGKEEKSRLTTKSKADSAYTTIVGVEVRDPSVMHWQEGNRLLVNVFPCTKLENRRFKIGVTIPLNFNNNRLTLENIKFEGPETKGTKETTVLVFESQKSIKSLDIPQGYTKTSSNSLQYSGIYIADWQLSFDASEIAENSFSFGGFDYGNKPLNYSDMPISTKVAYLDINSSWTENEYREVRKLLKGKEVYVYHDKPILLNNENYDLMFELLNKLNFSLFPIDAIKENNALIVSKSTADAPNYSDLKESIFIDKTAKYISSSSTNIFLYNIGSHLSPFLQTLCQFRVVNYFEGSVAGLEQIVAAGKFPVENTEENEVSLQVSQLKIVKTTNTTLPSNAPDHLMRLYAYNKIVQAAGNNFFNENYLQKELIAMAEEAYIVSPVSSMVVLETIKDYERFDIDENKNSLGNATANGHGGVPEPHEWLLIIFSIIAALLLSLQKRNKFAK